MALRERAAKPEIVPQLAAFARALTSRDGLSPAVKPTRWKKIVKRQAISASVRDPGCMLGRTAPFLKGTG